jgi:D-glycero-D-manno-heptose 1,7-bisphosphate phosphatase
MKNKAVFLDRDGTLNKLVFREIKNQETAPWTLEEFEIYDGVKEALDMLKSYGFLNLVITNQPDVLDGFLTPENSVKITNKLMKDLPIDEVFECYKRGDWKYKPNPGNIDLAAHMFGLALDDCYYIGDSWKDSVCAALRKIRYVHVGPTDPVGPIRYHAYDFYDAATWVAKHWRSTHE